MKLKSVLVSLDPLSLPRLEAILAYAREHDWAVILEDRLPESGLDRIDGALVTLRGKKEQLDKVRALQKRGKPVIDLTIACPKVNLTRVISDHKALGALAAQHFLERGFTNFAWYASGSSHVHDLRRQGYVTTLKQKGYVPVSLPWSLADATSASLPHPITDATSAALPHPLAVLAYDESDAAHVIEICHALKLDVPGDVAVLGIGNDHFLCENGDLTISSVDQNLVSAAHEACKLLDRLMARQTKQLKQSNKPNNQRILIPPAGIIPRASTETLAHPDPTIRAALVYIHRHLNKPFGAAETANAIHVARSTLDHLFTEKIGHSIGTEILQQRLTRAKRLLKDPTLALKSIAAVCGFCNASYFTNVFRRETGLTPKAWRKERLRPAADRHHQR